MTSITTVLSSLVGDLYFFYEIYGFTVEPTTFVAESSTKG